MNVTTLFRDNLVLVFSILVGFVLLMEGYVAYDQNKTYPLVKDFINENSSEDGFVHVKGYNVSYELISDLSSMISYEAAVMWKQYSVCKKNNIAIRVVGVPFLDEPPTSWYYLTQKNRKSIVYEPFIVNGLQIDTNLLTKVHPNTVLIPSKSMISRFQGSETAQNFSYIGNGWFYSANGYNVNNEINRIKKEGAEGSNFPSFSGTFFIGSPILQIGAELVYQLYKYLKNRTPDVIADKDDNYINSLFDNCRPGDIKMRILLFNPQTITIVGYKNRSIVTQSMYKNVMTGGIVSGIKSAIEILRPPSPHQKTLNMWKSIAVVLLFFITNRIYNRISQKIVNSCLVSSAVLLLRSLFWGKNPIVWSTLLIMVFTIKKGYHL